MFQNISFPFLSALAFISWTIMCYFHIIEEQVKSDDYNVEIYTERSRSADRPQYCPINSKPTIISRACDLVVSYGLILAATVAFSKLLKYLEMDSTIFLEKESANLSVEESFPNIAKKLETETEKNEKLSSQYLQHNLELREQLDDLQARCQELLQELRIGKRNGHNNDDALDDSNPSTTSLKDSDESFMSTDSSIHNCDDNSGVIMWKQPAEFNSSRISVLHSDSEVSAPMSQNVYVTHSHIHINFNGPVRLSQQNLNINRFRLKELPRNSEFRQVWGNYLKGPNEIPMLTSVHNIIM
ncbi:uncharacterized protein LOC133842232 [Drosophila sulfurigaster albostrigata]|uniref:uncharacterized protein LOC133842232 n=1 Tax=Drosophila sulfurigaster albostrigata TaxID=89887 RepID=UPI002D218448|nr:uncharacterized protein LOC133842232 [Drosophila sulfurigaster albostrigata]